MIPIFKDVSIKERQGARREKQSIIKSNNN